MINTKTILIKYNDRTETIVTDVLGYWYCSGEYIVTIYNKSKSTPVLTSLYQRKFTNVYTIVNCQSELEWHHQQIKRLQIEIDKHINESKVLKEKAES